MTQGSPAMRMRTNTHTCAYVVSLSAGVERHGMRKILHGGSLMLTMAAWSIGFTASVRRQRTSDSDHTRESTHVCTHSMAVRAPKQSSITQYYLLLFNSTQ